MSNILLVEPDYASKFPPLGLMKLSTWHKRRGDQVNFVRGCDCGKRNYHWHRIYVSSLFTWEMPRTLRTVKYYLQSVSNPKDIFVGGIGATLLPDFIKSEVDCTVIEGQIEKRGILGRNSPPVAEMIPDYEIINSVQYNYVPKDAYFIRITKGCVRSCPFCAVPILEKEYGYLSDLKKQVNSVKKIHGEKQNMVIMDNNILAIKDIDQKIQEINDLGFTNGAVRNSRQRTVDFNQGIDARIIAQKPILARHLAKLPLKPVRLAFDYVDERMERDYRKAVRMLAKEGFDKFTNYMLYNYDDTPADFYYRLCVNADINDELGIQISGFPMRYIPPSDTHRGYISSQWNWRYLRGIQCILQATHGLVSPNKEFMKAAFGDSFDDFLEILSMPDRYIIYRDHFRRNAAEDWLKEFRALTADDKDEFIKLLTILHRSKDRKTEIRKHRKFRSLIEHYYPNGTSLKMIGIKKEK